MSRTAAAALALALAGCGEGAAALPDRPLVLHEDAPREVRPMSAPVGRAVRRREPPATPPGAVERDAAPAAPRLVVLASHAARALGAERWLVAFGRDRGFAVEMLPASDRGAIEDVLQDEAAAALTVEAPSERERALGADAVALGHDAAVLVVHPDSRVRSLTPAQARAVLTGGVARWNEVAFEGGAVELLCGPAGPLAALRTELLLAGDRVSENAERFGSAKALLQQVSRRRTAVAMACFTDALRDGSVRMVALGGVRPDAPALRSGRYPATVTLYLVTAVSDGAGPDALRAFARSPASAAVVARHLVPASGPPPVPDAGEGR